MYTYMLLIIIMRLYYMNCVDDNLFIITYFENRRITNIVGFTCEDNEQSTFISVKMFNSNMQIVKIYHLRSDSIKKLALLKRTWNYVGIFIDKGCRDSDMLEQLYSESSKYYMYSNVYKWLIVSIDLKNTLRYLNDTNFSMNTDLIIAVSKSDEYVLHEAYNICKYRNGQLVVNNLGKWKSGDFNITFYNRNVSRRFDHTGITVKIAGLTVYRPKDEDVVTYLGTYKNKSKDTFTKYTYAIVSHISNIFNFTLDASDYTKWQSNDKLGPVVRGLHTRLIDVCGSPTIMTQERAKYLTFLFPIWPFRTFFIFRTTSLSHIRLQEFLLPFAKDCWYYISFLTAGAIIIFGIVLPFENMSSKLEAYALGLVITIGSICQQGSAYIPIKSSGRVAFFNIMLFSVMLYNYYNASIVSTRLDKPLDKMNDSLVELSKADIKLAAEPSLFFEFVLNQSDWELITFKTKRWLKIPKNERFISTEEGIKNVLQGGFGFHTTPEAGYPLIERYFDNRKICELTEVHTVRPSFLYINTRLNSPFSEMIKLGCSILYERGLMKRQIKRWQIRTPECRRDVLSAESITMVEVAPTFFLLITGFIFSIIIYKIEKIIYCKSHKQNSKLEKNEKKLKVKKISKFLLKKKKNVNKA